MDCHLEKILKNKKSTLDENKNTLLYCASPKEMVQWLIQALRLSENEVLFNHIVQVVAIRKQID